MMIDKGSRPGSTRGVARSARRRVSCHAIQQFLFWWGVAAGLNAQAPPPEQHWSYRPLTAPSLPPPDDEDPEWARDPMDRFVLARMRANGLRPAPAADRATWLRRAALSLCGLPPAPEEVEAFVRDGGDDAYARQVDRLLADPAFGERWAVWWLDLARYADSQGYEKDALRPHMWRWRDWVVQALQRDLPFDRFTIEQLAGDLLPAATLEQRVATAFHRNTMTNTEGGTDDEEFRVAAVVDRVNTTMSVWMGSTVGCAQCHDHKYDPISQREYYRLFAFFDQTADHDAGDEQPTLAAPTEEEQRQIEGIEARIAALQQQIDAAAAAGWEAWAATKRSELAVFAAGPPVAGVWRWLGPLPAGSVDAAHARDFQPEKVLQLDGEQEGRRWQARPDFVDGEVYQWDGTNSAFYLHRTIDAPRAGPAVLALGSDDAVKVWWNGVLVRDHKVQRPAAPEQELVPVELRAGRNEVLLKVSNGDGPGGFCFELRATALGAVTDELLRRPADAWSDDDRAALRAAFAAHADAVAEPRARIANLRADLAQLPAPQLPVMQELPPGERRTTRVLLRGSHLSPGDVVTPGVPACWPALPEGADPDRLLLARWLVSDRNPLVARVQVNRIWEQVFGRGLVATGGDFGTQGERPTHPQLLDWLACSFRDDGWSLKRLLRRIVLSATFGQSSAVPAAARERDPDNVFLARGPRLRLPAEFVRDQALFVSGLLDGRIGGAGVMPPQPDGVWGQIYSNAGWVTSEGGNRHRRSLYTLWRRTSPHPAMTTFDAPSREFCVLHRVQTNTPLQALVTWNDPQFTECAEALAARVLREEPGDDRARLRRMFMLCLLRAPEPAEEARLLDYLRTERSAASPAAAADPRRPSTRFSRPAGAGAAGVDPADLRPWVACASVVLNLDEFLTRP